MEGEPSAEGKSLCLNCRDVGHIMEECSKPVDGDDMGWFFSSKRKLMKASIMPVGLLCKRCESLGLIQLLQIPGSENGFEEFRKGSSDATRNFRNLGFVGTVIFSEECPVCRCLFMITPNPANPLQEVLIFAGLTACRVKTLNTIAPDGKNPYARCLVVVLWPPTSHIDIEDPRGDALCIVEEEEKKGQTDKDAVREEEITFRLGGRVLDSEGYSLNVLKEWLSRCDRLHPATCQLVWNEELKEISLLDVYSRKVMKHPMEKCDYIALSYVWGAIQQPRIKIGSTLGELPRTIEDAMKFVKALGKQYLWVDSICIDQGRDEHKRYQISIMCSIYQGAYATIVALSGESGTAGLPMLNPQVSTYDQFSCVIDGEKLVTIMPTLSQAIWISPWGSRAWTFQEALLSTRCFYFTEHQVWFECNSMTCCESLNDSKSQVHNLYWDTKFIEEEQPEAKYGKGILRNPFVGESRRPERLEEYGNLLALYSYRSMTKDYDGINAFSGILQALKQDLYPKGFFWGLPIEHFNFGLMWTCRTDARRREGFPSWSWAAWEGPKWPQVPTDGVVEKDIAIQPALRISRFTKGVLEVLFETTGESEGATNTEKTAQGTAIVDPVSKQNVPDKSDKKPNISDTLNAEISGLLYIEGIILRFIPHKYKPPKEGKWEEGRQISTTLQGREIPILYTYSGEGSESRLGTPQDFLLLARESCDEYIVHRLLMVDINEDQNTAIRVAPLKLWVPSDALSVIQDASPVIRNILLA